MIDDEYIEHFVLDPTAEHLDFANSNQNVALTDAGIALLSEKKSILSSKVLRTIDLSRATHITTIRPLIDTLLSQNDTIREIKLSGCPGVPEGELRELREVLSFNSQPPLLKMHLFRMHQQALHRPLASDADEAATTALATSVIVKAFPGGGAPDEEKVDEEELLPRAATPPFLSPPPPPIAPPPARPAAVRLDLDEHRSCHPYDDDAVRLLVESVLLPFPPNVHQFRIRDLILSNNSGITPASAKLLARWLPLSVDMSLLDLSHTQIASDGIWSIAEGLRENTSLRTLLLCDVGGCELVAATALAGCLTAASSTTTSGNQQQPPPAAPITHLDITHNSMQPAATSVLISAFVSHASLRVLKIEKGNAIDESAQRELVHRTSTLDECPAVVAAVSTLTAFARGVGGDGLTSLRLAGLGDSLTDRAVAVLVAALEDNATVTEVDVSGSGITCVGLAALCRWIGLRQLGETLVFRAASLRLEDSRSFTKGDVAIPAPFAMLSEMLAAAPPFNSASGTQPRACCDTLRVLDVSHNVLELGVRENDLFNLLRRCSQLQEFGVLGLPVLRSIPADSDEYIPGDELQKKIDLLLAAARTGNAPVAALIETLLLLPRTSTAIESIGEAGSDINGSSEDFPLLLEGDCFDDEVIALFSHTLQFLAAGSSGPANPLPFRTLRLENTSITDLGCDFLATALLKFSTSSLPNLRGVQVVRNTRITDDGVGCLATILQLRIDFTHFCVCDCPQVSCALQPGDFWEPAERRPLGSLGELLRARTPLRVIDDLLEYNTGTRTLQAAVRAFLAAAYYNDDCTDGCVTELDLSSGAFAAGCPALLEGHPIARRLASRAALAEAGTPARSHSSRPGVASLSAFAAPTPLIINFSQSTDESTGLVDDAVVRCAVLKYWLGAPRAVPRNVALYSLIDTVRLSNNAITENGLVDLLSLLCGGINSPSTSGPKAIFHLRVLDVANNLIVENSGSALQYLLPTLIRRTGTNASAAAGRGDSSGGDTVAHFTAANLQVSVLSGETDVSDATALPFLEAINLSFNDLADETIAALATCMHEQRCSHPSLCAVTADELPRLRADTRELLTRANAINAAPMAKAAMFALGDLMAAYPEGSGIIEADFDFGGARVNDEQFVTICEFLARQLDRCPTSVRLRTFSCRGSTLRSPAESVRSMLPLLRVIACLDMADCGLDSAAALLIATAVDELGADAATVPTTAAPQSPPLLEALLLAGNASIRGADVADRLLATLHRNTSLLKLDLHGTGLAPLAIDAATERVHLNAQPTLQRLAPLALAADIHATYAVLREPFDDVTLRVLAKMINASPFLHTIDFGEAGRTESSLTSGGRAAFNAAWRLFCEALAHSGSVRVVAAHKAALEPWHVFTFATLVLCATETKISHIDLRGNPRVLFCCANFAAPEHGVLGGRRASLDMLVTTPSQVGRDASSEMLRAVMASPLLAQCTSPIGAHTAGRDAAGGKTRSDDGNERLDSGVASPLPALASPDIDIGRREFALQMSSEENIEGDVRIDVPCQVADDRPGVHPRPPTTLGEALIEILRFHNTSVVTLDSDDQDSAAGAAVELAVRRNRGHSVTVKRDLIALDFAVEELTRLRESIVATLPPRGAVVSAAGASVVNACGSGSFDAARSITTEIAWAGQDLHDDAVVMLCEILEALLALCRTKVHYGDETSSALASLEVTEIDLRANPRLTSASLVLLSGVVAEVMQNTHRLPSLRALRYSMLRLDHCGSAPQHCGELAASLSRTLRDCPFLLLRCDGCPLLDDADRNALNFISSANEEPMRFRDMLLNFADSPPSSAIFSFFPTEAELEVLRGIGATPPQLAPLRPLRPEPPSPALLPTSSTASPARRPPAIQRPLPPATATTGPSTARLNACTSMSMRRQLLHYDADEAERNHHHTSPSKSSHSIHHLRLSRGLELTDSSMELLANRLTMTVAGRQLCFRKIVLPNNSISTSGFVTLLRALSITTPAPRHLLATLDLRNNRIDDECLDDLLEFMSRKAESLEHVDLAENHLTAAVVAPLLGAISANAHLRSTLRRLHVEGNTALMPCAASDKLRFASQLHTKGADVETLGWGIVQLPNDPYVFQRRTWEEHERAVAAATAVEAESKSRGTVESPVKQCGIDAPATHADAAQLMSHFLAGHLDLTRRVHSPSAAAMLLKLCICTGFTRGITVVNLSGSGVSSFEKTGFRRHRSERLAMSSTTPIAATSWRPKHNSKDQSSSNGEDCDVEYFGVCDLLIEFVTSCETLTKLDLSHNNLSVRSVLMPLMFDAVRLNRTLTHVDISHNCDPAEATDEALAPETAAAIIDDGVLGSNRFLQRVTLGPIAQDTVLPPLRFTHRLEVLVA